MTDYGRRWGVILAGGDGTRLRLLTRELAGDDRPKQYCRILGAETLLDQTRRRVALSVSPLRTLVVVTRHHERFYREALAELPPHAVVVQPANRGTAAGILYPLLRLEALTATDAVALFPSDHHVGDDETFMAHVDAAFDAVRACPDLTVLLGIRPDRAEVEYGWIEPGAPILPLAARPGPRLVTAVRRFWEKPKPKVAAVLEARGCLWNSFVMVARVATLLGLVLEAAPDLYARLAPVRAALDGPHEARAVEAAYAALPPVDFSRDVLARHPARLAVLPVSGTTWSDLGDPARVFAARRAVAEIGPSRPVAVGQ
jgi:mannose-1-phosphate guanylyltransferase